MEPKLIVMGVEGTLVQRYTTQLLPCVSNRLSDLRLLPNKPTIALVTNQGGVGLRYDLEQAGDKDKADAKGYPDQEVVELRLGQIAAVLGIPFSRIYISFAYKAPWGVWSPTPMHGINDQRWSRNWRLPNTGMLFQAMADANMGPAETLVVGSTEAEERAARLAKCSFIHADSYFRELVPA